MEEKKLYQRILVIALGILLILCALSLFIMQDYLYPLSVFIGGMMAMVGFVWIVFSTQKVITSPKATALAMTSYLLRYLFYGGILLISILSGLNIVASLVGFLCINFAIKLNTYLQRKEDD